MLTSEAQPDHCEHLAEREAEITLSLVKRAIHWKTKMNQVEGFVNIGEPFSKHVSKAEASPVSRFVQKAPDDIRWTINRTDFNELIAVKKDSAPGLDGIPYGAYRCAGSLGSQFLFNAYRSLEGGTVPEHIAESRTVFIPKTSDIDDNVRLIRSPDALRPLTLCNCGCKLPTSAFSRASVGTT